MERSPDERPGQDDAIRRGSLVLDHKAIIAVVLFVVLGTVAMYIGFHTLPAPKSTVMEPMLGMADGKMDSMSSMSGMSSGSMKAMPTMTAGMSHLMPGMGSGSTHAMPSMAAGSATMPASNNAGTVEDVRVYFRDTFNGQAAYAMISGYAVDRTLLTIQTNIDGMDQTAMSSGQQICGYADQLMKHGNTAIEHYEVLNRGGDKLCASGM